MKNNQKLDFSENKILLYLYYRPIYFYFLIIFKNPNLFLQSICNFRIYQMFVIIIILNIYYEIYHLLVNQEKNEYFILYIVK